MKSFIGFLCGAMFLISITACSNHSEVPEETPVSEPWNVTVSRAGTGADESYNRILIRGKKDGSTASVSGVLGISDTTGTWEGITPTWPKENGQDVALDVYAISPVPTNNVLPTSVDLSTGSGTAWVVDYQTDAVRPNKFTMKHLLAKLVVHVRIDGETNPQPTDGKIRLAAKGEIDYATKRITTTPADSVDVLLGTFHQEGQDTLSTVHNWEMKTAIVVIPQTLKAKVPCLWFTAGGQSYRFLPDTDLTIEVGRVNNLYLGIASDGLVHVEGITVAGWIETEINAGEAEE